MLYNKIIKNSKNKIIKLINKNNMKCSINNISHNNNNNFNNNNNIIINLIKINNNK